MQTAVRQGREAGMAAAGGLRGRSYAAARLFLVGLLASFAAREADAQAPGSVRSPTGPGQAGQPTGIGQPTGVVQPIGAGQQAGTGQQTGPGPQTGRSGAPSANSPAATLPATAGVPSPGPTIATGPAAAGPAATPGAGAGATVDPAAAVVERQRQTQSELDALARDIRTSEEREAQIRLEIEGLERDRTRISAQLVETAARVRGLEDAVSATEARIGTLDGDTARIRRSLADRRAVLADVLAALQRIGRKPPPALLVRPEDALASVRSAILVGALLPELRREAEILIADLDRMVRLRDQSAAERDRFKSDMLALAEERSRLELLFEQRRRSRLDQQKKLDDERRRSQELAGKATSLKDLVTRLELEIDGARRAAEAARRAEDEARAHPPAKDQKSVTAALQDPGRLQPALPFSEARGRLPMPAAGIRLKGFGDDDGLGGTIRGIQIATRPDARVSSPCDGWILFAGSFRSYGKLLIINGGGGYHVVLAGMDRIDVEIGQFVLAGEPVGSMGSRRLASAAVGPGPSGTSGPGGAGAALSGQTDAMPGQPVLYVEFRKENSPIDPTPWWGHSRDEKVRG